MILSTIIIAFTFVRDILRLIGLIGLPQWNHAMIEKLIRYKICNVYRI